MNGKKGTKYVLNSAGEPVVEPDLTTWAQWYEKADRIVKQEQVGAFLVSTVFLGIDHNYSEDGPPVLWETMVFLKGCFPAAPKRLDLDMDRCSGTREQACAMHQAMVEHVASIPVITESPAPPPGDSQKTDPESP